MSSGGGRSGGGSASGGSGGGIRSFFNKLRKPSDVGNNASNGSAQASLSVPFGFIVLGVRASLHKSAGVRFPFPRRLPHVRRLRRAPCRTRFEVSDLRLSPWVASRLRSLLRTITMTGEAPVSRSDLPPALLPAPPLLSIQCYY